MSDVQYSDDGQYWWDDQAQEWKAVESNEGEGSEQEGQGGQPTQQMSESEAADYFAQAMDAAMGEVYEA
jgi:hypothetical protein